MIRVLMVSGEYPPGLGGVGDYTACLCRALDPGSASVAVLTSGQRGTPPDVESQHNPHLVERVVGRWGLGAWRQVTDAARRTRAEVVHVQYQAGAYQLDPAVNLLPLWLRARLPRVRSAVTFHDLRPPYLFPKAGRLRPAIVRLMAHASDGVVCTDPADLQALGPAAGRRCIPLGSNIEPAPLHDFDAREWRRGRGLPTDAPLVGFFGFMNATKGADALFHALAELPGVHLALIGAEVGANNATDLAEAARLRGVAEALGLEGRIWRSGPLSVADVSAALRGCDLIALPFTDGASARRGSLVAALGHGRAVVTTSGPGSALLRHEHDALLVVPGDAPALAEAIRGVLADPALRTRLEAGASAVAARYTWPAIAEQHLDWYHELVERPRGRAR